MYKKLLTHLHKIINVPVFYMACGLMILMGANPLLWPLEGVGPEKSQLFWPKLHLNRCQHFGTKKVSIFRAHPFHGPNNGFAHIKIITFRAI